MCIRDSFIDDLRTATLWVKGVSKFTPWYYVDFLETSPWIHQPFEKYEEMDIEELRKDHSIKNVNPNSTELFDLHNITKAESGEVDPGQE